MSTNVSQTWYATGPTIRWLRQLRTMNDILGYILFVFGFFRSCLVSLWEVFASRERANFYYATETVELPDLVDLVEPDQIEAPPTPNRRRAKRKLPVPPAFVNEKDYPVDWLVYSKHLGVIPKRQADLIDEPAQRIAQQAEEKKLESGFGALVPPPTSRSAPSSPRHMVNTIPHTKPRSQSEDSPDEAKGHITSSQFSPFMQSVVAT
jgi:hypothetical protein